ncbi:hypothetical protein [Treponema berlinense]|uniref:hypothetical protein n=1 Tax=Treponema berlinense TaxID=225004 RepID=UPI0026F1B892|nr:hypothetical protein [Treponema berlinense]
MKIESSVHQERIKNIYDEYKNTVFPLVAFLEANDAEFPIEILNEVRSIFSYFSRVYDDSVTDDEIDCELSKAENHLKRAILDCYKYNCISLYDFYNRFRTEYKFADLSLIDNGDFLAKITQNFAEGKRLLFEAKKSERKNKHSEDLYMEFEAAFDLFLKNFNLINSKIALVHKVSKKARWTRFWGTFGFWISLALAVAGIILSVV